MTVTDSIALISTTLALAAVFFSWRAVKTAQRTNSIGVFTQLHQLYHSDNIFTSSKVVWDISLKMRNENSVFAIEKIDAFILNENRASNEWKAIHDQTNFWRYVGLLIDKSYVEQDIAFNAFGSPNILNFLVLFEDRFLILSNISQTDKTYLAKLHDTWLQFNNSKN